MTSTRKTLPTLGLLLALTLTGCANVDADAPAPSLSAAASTVAPSSTPTPTPVPVTLGDEEDSGTGSTLSGLPAAVTADAMKTANGFLAHYVNHTMTSNEWVSALVPFSTPMMVENLIGTEPSQIPFTGYGELFLDDGPTVNNVRVVVETEGAGTWTLLLMRQRSAEKFLVGEIEMPEGTR